RRRSGTDRVRSDPLGARRLPVRAGPRGAAGFPGRRGSPARARAAPGRRHPGLAVRGPLAAADRAAARRAGPGAARPSRRVVRVVAPARPRPIFTRMATMEKDEGQREQRRENKPNTGIGSPLSNDAYNLIAALHAKLEGMEAYRKFAFDGDQK